MALIFNWTVEKQKGYALYGRSVQDFLKETYEDMVADGYTFDEFMNNLRNRAGEICSGDERK